MGIINHYHDIKLALSDFSEDLIGRIVADREFAVIKVPVDIYNKLDRNYIPRDDFNWILFRYSSSFAVQIEAGNDPANRYCLLLKDNTRQLPRRREIEGVEITYPTVDELIKLLQGKRLLFTCRFAEDYCAVEEVVNKTLQKDVFRLRNEKEYYYTDEFFHVKIFLQQLSADSAPERQHMQPIDVRNLDINAKLLTILKEKSNSFYCDAEIMTYAAESEKLQAQYFLSKFHSNRLWSADPVNILNCRISAFVLPSTVSSEAADALPEDRIAFDTVNGAKYAIDSIHMGSDICFGVSEFEELIMGLMVNISMD